MCAFCFQYFDSSDLFDVILSILLYKFAKLGISVWCLTVCPIKMKATEEK